MKGLSVKSPQKGGWSIDCEVGASLGDEKMQKDLQQLKDEVNMNKLLLCCLYFLYYIQVYLFHRIFRKFRGTYSCKK